MNTGNRMFLFFIFMLIVLSIFVPTHHFSIQKSIPWNIQLFIGITNLQSLIKCCANVLNINSSQLCNVYFLLSNRLHFCTFIHLWNIKYQKLCLIFTPLSFLNQLIKFSFYWLKIQLFLSITPVYEASLVNVSVLIFSQIKRALKFRN